MNIFVEAAEGLKNPLVFDSIPGFLKGVLGVVMYIGIPFIGLILVYAGFRFLFARGKSEKITSAIFNIKWAIVGVAIFLGAWVLTTIIDSTIKNIIN